jgi:hypothetical protein
MITIKNLLLATLLFFFMPGFSLQKDTIQISGTLKGLRNKSVWISFSDDAGVSRSYKTSATNDFFTLKVPKQRKAISANLNISSANIKSTLLLLINNQNIKVSGEISDLPAAKISYGKKGS